MSVEIKYVNESNENKNLQYQIINDKNESFFMSEVAKRLKPLPEPFSIEIETVNKCNNDCAFCPVNRNDDIRHKKMMSEELFKNIIDDLSNRYFSGHINYFSNNEPLLDKRIVNFVSYGKNKLPYAIHHLYTNGLLLNESIFEELTSKLDTLVIDNYDDNLRLLPNIQNIIDENRYRDTYCKVFVVVQKKNIVRSTRGGGHLIRWRGMFHSLLVFCHSLRWLYGRMEN